MSKIGISVRIDVKKIDKARLYAAQTGAAYLDITMFLDPNNEGQYGDHGFVTQQLSKEERDQGIQLPILGNGKIFYGLQELQGNKPAPKKNFQQAQQGFQQQQSTNGMQQSQGQNFRNQNQQVDDFDDDLAF